MDSYVFRKIVIMSTYSMTIFSTVLDIDSLPSLHIFRCIGILFLIFTVIAGIRIHNMYPRRHDKPSDFPELLTKGTIRYM